MPNYGLTTLIDSIKLLEEGLALVDFPVLIKIPIANAANLFGTGETGDTVYFECEGEILKHELIEIGASYACFWVKMPNLSPTQNKAVTIHYGALVDNNYEDKRGVWTNAAYIYHFNGNLNDTMGNINVGTPTGTLGVNYEYDYKWGVHYKGLWTNTSTATPVTSYPSLPMPYTFMFIGRVITTPSYGCYLGNSNAWLHFGAEANAIRFYSGNGNYVSYTHSSSNYLNSTQHHYYSKYITGANIEVMLNGEILTTTTAPNLTIGAINDVTPTVATFSIAGTTATIIFNELFVFTDRKSPEWQKAFYRMYNNLNAYVIVGDEVNLDTLSSINSGIVACIANVVTQIEIDDSDYKQAIYESGNLNAQWRLAGNADYVWVWGSRQPRPLYGDFIMGVDNLEANDCYFYTFADYGFDIHDKITIEDVLFDVQNISVQDIGVNTISKVLVLKRQPQYYACCIGQVL